LGAIATLAVSLASGIVWVVDGYPLYGPGSSAWLDWFSLGFIGSLYIGGLVGLFYGVPLYTAFLLWNGLSFWILIILASIPGVILSFADLVFGIYLLSGGVTFLLIVHLLARKLLKTKYHELPRVHCGD